MTSAYEKAVLRGDILGRDGTVLLPSEIGGDNDPAQKLLEAIMRLAQLDEDGASWKQAMSGQEP